LRFKVLGMDGKIFSVYEQKDYNSYSRLDCR
jgi:hypothetical protein